MGDPPIYKPVIYRMADHRLFTVKLACGLLTAGSTALLLTCAR